VRKRGDETAEEIIGRTPPSEAWLLRTLAELRREQRYGDEPVARRPADLQPSRRERPVKRVKRAQ